MWTVLGFGQGNGLADGDAGQDWLPVLTETHLCLVVRTVEKDVLGVGAGEGTAHEHLRSLHGLDYVLPRKQAHVDFALDVVGADLEAIEGEFDLCLVSHGSTSQRGRPCCRTD